jgi:hypothetical protein
MPSLATIIISLTVVCSTACSANAAEGRYLCEPVVANGKSWTQLAGRKSKVFYVDASCRALDSPGKEYMPTGGGFMYDGGAEDPAMLSDWRIISSVPYDRTYSQNPDVPTQPAKSWRCVVRWMGQGEPKGKPESVWCWANCCHW